MFFGSSDQNPGPFPQSLWLSALSGIFDLQRGLCKRAKTERAARQQGSSFLRENSSNGGKTIRTFWLHSRGVGRECQGEIEEEISVVDSVSWSSLVEKEEGGLFGVCSPFCPRNVPSFQGVF
jgi:hypothetical protein